MEKPAIAMQTYFGTPNEHAAEGEFPLDQVNMSKGSLDRIFALNLL
jgi:hypothetical protein